jgi:hypothetical protein
MKPDLEEKKIVMGELLYKEVDTISPGPCLTKLSRLAGLVGESIGYSLEKAEHLIARDEAIAVEVIYDEAEGGALLQCAAQEH